MYQNWNLLKQNMLKYVNNYNRINEIKIVSISIKSEINLE